MGARVLYKQLLVDVIIIVGASLSEPHTSRTAFIAKTCVYVCWIACGPYTYSKVLNEHIYKA